MRRLALVAVALGLLSAPRGARGEADAPAPTLSRFTLDNGMRVVVEPSDSGRAFVMVRYDSGAGDDPPGYRGLHHLTEHLAFGAGKVQTALEDLGACYFNGYTSLDETFYVESVPVAVVERVLWQESERMAFLLENLQEKDVAHESRIVARELDERTHATVGVGQAAAKSLFPAGHPYHLVHDDPKDLAAIRLAHVQWHAQSVYRPERATLVVTGGVVPAQVHAWAKRYFGAVHPSSTPHERTRPGPLGPLSRSCTVHTGQRTVDPSTVLAWRMPPRDSDDSPVIDVIAALLGGPRQARLTRALTQADGPASSVDVVHIPLELDGMLTILLAGRRDTELDPMIAQVDRELRAIAQGALKPGELEAARAYVLRGYDRDDRSPQTRALALATARDDDALARKRRVVTGLTARALQRVAARWLDPRRRVAVRTDCKTCARERVRCEEVSP